MFPFNYFEFWHSNLHLVRTLYKTSWIQHKSMVRGQIIHRVHDEINSQIYHYFKKFWSRFHLVEYKVLPINCQIYSKAYSYLSLPSSLHWTAFVSNKYAYIISPNLLQEKKNFKRERAVLIISNNNFPFVNHLKKLRSFSIRFSALTLKFFPFWF